MPPAANNSSLTAEDDLLRPERLIGGQRRADAVAAPALGAGVAVEQLLPGELADLVNAVVLALLDVGDELERAARADSCGRRR